MNDNNKCQHGVSLKVGCLQCAHETTQVRVRRSNTASGETLRLFMGNPPPHEHEGIGVALASRVSAACDAFDKATSGLSGEELATVKRRIMAHVMRG